MADTAWESLLSANKKAELKYRNMNPTIKFSLGCATEKSSRDLVPKKKKPSSLFNTIEEKYQGYTFQSIPDLTFLRRSDHLVTSEFASVDYPYGRITVFNPKGKIVNSFCAEEKGKNIYLFGLTSLPNDDLAVCTGDGLSLWNAEGRLLLQFSHINVENCCHVSSMKNGFLATTCITELKEKCVTLWDPRCAKVVSQFGSRPEVIEVNPLKQKQKYLIRNSDIRLPWFIASDSRSNVYIADRNAQCIKVFDTRNRKFLFRFDTAGVDTRCRKGALMPQGIDIDEDDNIFVADEITNSVLIFDSHGEYVRGLNVQLDNDMCQVWALALSHLPPSTQCKRNKLLSPSRKIALSYSNRRPRARIYDLSFCRHYSIGF